MKKLKLAFHVNRAERKVIVVKQELNEERRE